MPTSRALILLPTVGLMLGACEARHDLKSYAREAPPSTTSSALDALPSSPAATARFDALRARFSLLGSSGVIGFERTPSELSQSHVRARLSPKTIRNRMSPSPALVDLPRRASDAAILEEPRSHMRVQFALRGTASSEASFTNGYAFYPKALQGADVVHRIGVAGTEDFVAFDTRPAREELVYDVDVSRVPGLRLVSNTLEFLDAKGSPTLRIAPPYVVDANDQRHDAKIAVEGCAYDTNASAPWGRAVTPIGAASCTVHITWADVTYPALVDPAWSLTHEMVKTRRTPAHGARLPSGRVLILSAGSTITELFDETGNGGTGAFAATGNMNDAHGEDGTRYALTTTRLSTGNVLVVGGGNYSRWDICRQSATAEVYDHSTGLFTAISMNGPRMEHTATLLPSGKVLLVGGFGEDCATSTTAELFDPAMNGGAGGFVLTGAPGAGTAARRIEHTSTLLPDGRVLIAGGTKQEPYDPVVAPPAGADIYDPAADDGVGAFVETIPMPERRNHTATLLPSGKVLLAGGYDLLTAASGGILGADLFDPSTNSVVAVGSMAAPRSAHTATVLPSGRVLIAGGANGVSTELFDPATNSFLPVPSMLWNRNKGAAVSLTSGKVLLVGGQRLYGYNVDPPAEIFDEAASQPVVIDAGPATDAGPTSQTYPFTPVANPVPQDENAPSSTATEMIEPATTSGESGCSLGTVSHPNTQTPLAMVSGLIALAVLGRRARRLS